MKRLVLLLALITSFTMLNASSWYNANGIAYELYGDVFYVTGNYNGTPWEYKGDIEIPATYKPAGKAFEIYAIRANAFSNSPDVVDVAANFVERVESYAFAWCKRLKKVSLKRVRMIDSGAFSNCTNLGYIDLPSTLVSLGTKAFEDCTSLRYICIPSSVSQLGDNIFKGCSNLKVVKIEKNNESIYKTLCQMLDPSNTIICYDGYTEKEKIEKYWTGKLINGISTPTNVKAYAGACYFELVYEYQNEDLHQTIEDVQVEGIPAETTDSVISGSSARVKRCLIKGLQPLTDYVVKVTYSHVVGGSYHGPSESYDIIRTKNAECYISVQKKTQTSVRIKMSPTIDDYTVPSAYSIGFEGVPFAEDVHTIQKLCPGTTYSNVVYANYNGKWMGTLQSYITASMAMDIKADVTPTTIDCAGTYTVGDANIVRSWFEGYEDSDKLILTGLDPETEYTLKYNLELEDSQVLSHTKTFKTPKLELELLDPQPMTATDTRASASTNISEVETNVGFQWRKYDAPESLKSNEGAGVVFDNKIQGVIKRLQSTSYYNVRAFYKSNAGNYYFSEWITFDPSDFSYVEPIVHTYSDIDITDNSATIKLCVVEGSEEIIENGIQYWIDANSEVKAFKIIASAADYNIVIADKQSGSVTLKNLSPGTTYCYRTFVTTSQGTVYGKEQIFTTTGDPISTEIESVDSDVDNSLLVSVYYGISGRLVENPQHGVFIKKRKDGKIVKVLMP